jgi:hypothetical protein
MGVSDEDGHLIINASYLRDGDKREIYLDIIHEHQGVLRNRLH